jgi:hypothetical protein
MHKISRFAAVAVSSSPSYSPSAAAKASASGTASAQSVALSRVFAATAPQAEAEVPVRLREATPSGLVQTLWSLRAARTAKGRLVGVRLRGTVLKVALVAPHGVVWVSPAEVLTTREAAEWARTGQFYLG